MVGFVNAIGENLGSTLVSAQTGNSLVDRVDKEFNMSAIVHGMSLAHPLESLQQAPWFQALKAQFVHGARRFWQACELAGERRAKNHLRQLAAYYEGSDPQLARMLHGATR
jgi:hypothetical protein